MNDSPFYEKLTDAAKTIFSYCMAKTSNKEDAEDLSQDILYELIKSSGSIRDENAFYGFMWSVANNVYSHWYKKKLKNATCELDENIVSYEDLFNIEDNNDIYLLRRELTLLSEKYRKATILYYIDRKSCQEIAQELAISESMVKYLLFKSRKILKEGMNMERNLGELSYNPKIFVPLYLGSGPNRFWTYMSNKIRQNIVEACYNDALTEEQISLETGIPLAYLDDELKSLTDTAMLKKEGRYYKSNIIVINSECNEEMRRNASKYHKIIADKIEDFLDENAENFRKIGYVGSGFSENSLYWLMVSSFLLLAVISNGTEIFEKNDASELPKTAWGDNAYVWLVEKDNLINSNIFNFSQENSYSGDRVHFCEYTPCKNGNHLCGNKRYVSILCDIARGNSEKINESDLDVVAELIKLGYVKKNGNIYSPTLAVFTQKQYEEAVKLTQNFVNSKMRDVLMELDEAAERVLLNHTPKHLQKLVKGIAGTDKFINAACIPASILIEKGVLKLPYTPNEMSTNFIVLHN